MKDFKIYLQQQQFQASTIEEHCKNVKYFTQWLVEQQYQQAAMIRYNDLLAYIQYEKQRKISPATINLRLSSISYYFEFLKKQGEVEKNPAKTIRVKGVLTTVIQDPLSREELEALYHQYTTMQVNHKLNMIHARSAVILGLMIWQGVHSGELQKMEVGHIDLRGGKVYIPSTSRSNSRQLELSQKQVFLLHEYLTMIWLALRPKGNELIPGDIRNHISRVIQEVQGLNPVIRNAQHIRGSVILGWLKTHSKRQVQYMAGHKYISSTEKYAQQEMDTLKDELSKHHPFG